jgi:hypothetical protein
VGLNAGEKLLPPERLRDVVVGPGLEPADLLELCGTSGEHYHRHVADVANALERLPPIELGHRHVEEHEVGRDCIERAEAVTPVRALGDLVARPLEQLAKQPSDVCVIVDDEDAGPLHTRSIPDEADSGR